MEGAIEQARELNPEHICLYEGESERLLGAVAPWLFEFEQGSDFAQWISDHAHANSWGVLFRSKAEPPEVYRHLRKFLIVATEDGRELYFRFYDPRVLRVFLPTCHREQLHAFFGPIESFLAEDENGLLVEYALSEDALTSEDLGAEMSTLFNGDDLLKVRKEQIASENAPPQPTSSALPDETELQNPSSTGSSRVGSAKDENDKKGGSDWDFGY